MIKIGITGGIGSGKSTVSEIFRLMSIPVYNADIESKKLTNSSQTIRDKLISLFGKELYNNGNLDKKMLASLIFTNEENLKQVNNIIHPEVEKDFIRWANSKTEHSIVAHEAAILFEAGEDQLMDKVITVYTPLEMRIARVSKRDSTSREMVQERINNQMSEEEKIARSDYVVYNDEQHSLIEQVNNILTDINND